MTKKEMNRHLLKKHNLWDVYYVLLHCHILKPIYIDKNTLLVPFEEMAYNDFLEIVEKLTESSNSSSSNSEKCWKRIKEKINTSHKEKNPVALLIFKNIEAENTKEAHEKTRGLAQDIIVTVGVLTNSSIELKGWIFENNKGIIPDIHFPYYKPVYIDSNALEEISKKIVNKMNDNHLVKLALRYENEALAETEADFSLLKRWTALEFIGEEYSRFLDKEKLLSKAQIKTITKLIIKNVITEENEEIKNKIQNSLGHINHRNAKDKIRDLLNWLDYSLENFDNKKDILDVIYQNRNCITHNGGCYKYKEAKEECEGPAYCRNSNLDLKDLNKELSCILVHFIGKLVGFSLEYNPIPEDLSELKKINEKLY
ncbi:MULTISPECIES: hypothetical protein [Methanobacterium]|uniref:Apea-like HEPN domain-containing protein n=1 Tax=Methanobacterium bryantii TaxID=2161 RepID=A0A2A2H411_METBR|nr:MULTISPECIES: hypothetical protein [Methanobacterium]OEC86742.1 hypothetical protein A9507_09850 [Methanobacterium sp. A39]PAV04020.1 hypothetical protein ASJ80_03125 [Methanobacterium bryantii]